MASESSQESMARLLANTEAPRVAPKSPLQVRKSARSKSKSFGGAHTMHGLPVPLKEEIINRRKSAIIPAMRSILSGKEDEDEAKKRKEARRKSLANRRVSFAPEATLHTWDVIEYMRDANTTASSSSSSENTLGSSVRQFSSREPDGTAEGTHVDPTDPPSTPPRQVEEEQPEEGSASQRKIHQQKRRRGSSNGVPPMNFNNPEDFSSSPISGSSSPAAASPGESVAEDSDSDIGSDDENTITAMSLDMGIDEATGQSIASNGSSSSTGSSARLDEALRQAARAAGTHPVAELDDSGEASMEMVGDEVTNAFKPWIQQSSAPNLTHDTGQDKVNFDPFSPAPRMNAIARFSTGPPASTILSSPEDDATMDISMEMTKAVGGIVPFSSSSELNTSSDKSLSSDTMDLTMIMSGSGILSGATAMDPQNRRGSLKRRRSSMAAGTTTNESGSPAKKPAAGRRQSLRASRMRSSMAAVEDGDDADETMDLTAGLSTIREDPCQQLLDEQAEQLSRTQKSIEQQQESLDSTETSFGEVPMEMTRVLGGITRLSDVHADMDDTNEDLSMEFTTAIGKIQQSRVVAGGNKMNPPKAAAEVQIQVWGFPVQQDGPSSVPEPPQQLSPLTVNAQRSPGTVKITPEKSPRRPARRQSIMPSTPEVQIPATPQDQPSRLMPMNGRRSMTPRHGKSPLSRELKFSSEDDVAPATSKEDVSLPAPTIDPPEQLALPPSSPKQSSSPKLTPAVRSPLAPKLYDSSNRLPSPPAPKLSDSLKQLGTPRKQINDSPLKKIVAASTPRIARSPKKSSSPTKRGAPRKSTSPQKRAVKVVSAQRDVRPEKEQLAGSHVDANGPRIPLHEFLNMTGIKFMDLTTTKRRHTGFPTLSQAALLSDEDESAGGDGLDSLERTVVAATVLLPELLMYQHSCHEMKSYISIGKEVVRNIDAEVLDEQPALFREYASAPAEERAIMDDQFRVMKTNARLESKGSWYQWRSRLLNDLVRALTQTEVGTKDDDAWLKTLERQVDESLANLVEQKRALGGESAVLKRRKEERESGEREQLDAARSRLVDLDATTQEKHRLLQELREELQQQDEAISEAQERQEECVAAIKEAERVEEEYRGWSSDEVSSLRAQSRQFESTHHWSVLSATSNPSTLRLSYRSEVELFFHPFSFQDARSPMSSPSKAGRSNAPISLIYSPKDVRRSAEEPSTTQRFFLQLLRANLLGLPQSTTPIATLLKLVSQGWEKCRAVAEAVRQLEMLGMTDVAILGDEHIRVNVAILLPPVETKLRITFDVGVGVVIGEATSIEANFGVSAHVVYGEKYDELKMSEALKTICGEDVKGFEHAGTWSDAVDDLRRRLIKRGRKG